ncbi:NARROW LEAF 1-like protein [Drosera capensis]
MRLDRSRSTQSEESALDLEKSDCNCITSFPCTVSFSLHGFASGGQHSETNAHYFSWPTSSRVNDAAEDRSNYFGNLQKGVLPETLGRLPSGLRASTLLELMTIRAFHSQILRRFSLGTAVGFRIRQGVLTDIPAILVFVARKVHRQWLSHMQCLPAALEGPGGVWCDVDVLEFSYFGAPTNTPKEQIDNELVDGLRGNDPSIGSGSQVASQETYGTLGAIVRSRTGNRQVGFLTNRHVAVDLDYPSQKMFHPLPPNLGPGVYLGAVERATSFITDDLWYGIFAGTNPASITGSCTRTVFNLRAETFVRADGAFIPFAEDLNPALVTTTVKGVGELGEVNSIDLQSPIGTVVGGKVMKVGRSSGLTTGTIMAYALEYNDEKGICLFTDFLVVGENQQTFDLEGDSESLILLMGQNGEIPRPTGIIWGGTANRGRLKLKFGKPPENWTSESRFKNYVGKHAYGVKGFFYQDAMEEQRNLSSGGGVPILESSSAPPKDTLEANFEPLGLTIQHISEEVEHIERVTEAIIDMEDRSGLEASPKVELQFIPRCTKESPSHESGPGDGPQHGSLSVLRNSDEATTVSLELGEPEPKRRKQFDSRICINEGN